jgi:metallo-beta-lactamase class B
MNFNTSFAASPFPASSIRLTLLLAAAVLCTVPLAAQYAPATEAWNRPVPPFRIAGNLHYVGASDITAFLITTPAGHILLDGGFIETAPQILQNIGRLGYRAEDVKIVLNSQAHNDHAGGLAQIRRLTRAQLIMSQEDAELAARGGAGDFGFGDRLLYPPVRADRIISDRETVRLGGTHLTAHITRGHTRGCTTWTMQVEEEGAMHDVVFLCSATVPGYQLVGNADYPEIIDDYRATFARLRTLKPSIFLASHGNFFQLERKRKLLAAGEGGRNPFIDPEGWERHLDAVEAAFEKLVREQTAAAAAAVE